MRHFTIRISLFAVVLLVSVPAYADLINRGNGLIYDTALNVTWLQDANYAATELTADHVTAVIAEVGSVAGHTLTTDDFFANGTGKMTWWGSMAWVQALNYEGLTDWRLPSMDANGDETVANCETNTDCLDNEYGAMFYQNLNGTVGVSKIGNQVGDGGIIFTNIAGGFYWSATPLVAAPDDCSPPSGQCSAWGFYFDGGQGFGASLWADRVAWAVHDGDVARPVPEPATLVLLLGGGAFTGMAQIRRKKQPRYT